MIAATENANQAHLETLALLSQMLMDEDLRKRLMAAGSKEEVLEIIAVKEREINSAQESDGTTADESTGSQTTGQAGAENAAVHSAEAGLRQMLSPLAKPGIRSRHGQRWSQ